tara:strand:- start:1915 stop:2352 length:438 start_codon:yes stop_codon:yes gene_type:complete
MSNIFPVLSNLRGLDSPLFRDFFDYPAPNIDTKLSKNTHPPMANVIKTDRSCIIEMALPGFSRNDIDISLEGGTLTISSVVLEKEDETNPVYETREFNYTSFSRSWRVPKNINSENISARYEAGILEVILPVDSKALKRQSISID